MVRLNWARLLKRVFDIDIERCACGGQDAGSGPMCEFQRKTPGQTKHYGRLTGRRVGDILAAGKKGGLKFLFAMTRS